jgi:hypothetical protein
VSLLDLDHRFVLHQVKQRELGHEHHRTRLPTEMVDREPNAGGDPEMATIAD